MKPVFKKIRLPRKVMFVIAGVLVLSGASGAFAVYSAKDLLLGSDEEKAPSPSGIACTTIETLKMRRNGQRWIRKYVSTETADGVDRVRTALRITGLLAKEETADLYQVVVLDQAGPQDRADRRGPAIGAEVLFAPDPTKLPGMSTPFVARYNESKANTIGLFYGREVALSTDDIKTTLVAMEDKSDCFDPVAAAAAAAHGAAGTKGGGHGAEASGEGEAAGHGEAPAEHGAEAAPEHGAEAAPEHGAEAASEHGDAKPAEKGFFGSMLAMVMGSGEEEPVAPEHGEASGHDAAPAEHGAETLPENGKAADHGAAPAENGGEAAAPEHGAEAAPEHGAEAPSEHGEAAPAEKGIFGSMLAMVMGSGEDEPVAPEPVEASGHGEAPVEHGAEAVAPEHGAEAAPEHGEASGHGEAPVDHSAEAVSPEAGHGETKAEETKPEEHASGGDHQTDVLPEHAQDASVAEPAGH